MAHQRVSGRTPLAGFMGQPGAGDAVQLHFGETLQRVTGEGVRHGRLGQLQKVATLHQPGEVLAHKRVDMFLDIVQKKIPGNALNFHTVFYSDLPCRKCGLLRHAQMNNSRKRRTNTTSYGFIPHC